MQNLRVGDSNCLTLFDSGANAYPIDEHKVFTQAYREQQRDSNHALYAFDIRELLMETSGYINNREIRFDSPCKIKTSFYSSLFEDEILQEMVFEPGMDLEKSVDEPQFLANFVIDENRNHFCSVHKAVVPITRM